MTRPIQLADVGMPPLDVPEALPAVAAAEFEERIAALLAAVDVDMVVVYGDREHAASLVFLCNLDPRFEEVLLVLGRGRRTLLLGKEDIGYVPIVPIEVDAVLCPTLSLMGIDRSGGPTVEQALRDAGVGKGDRVGVVGWKTLLPEESSGTFAPIFAPSPTSIGPSTCAPDPMTTPLRSVGWRLPPTPVVGLVPPSVTC